MDRTPYGGGTGAGLKAKRDGLSIRRSSTPYQRPTSGRHASAGRHQAAALGKPGSGSWVASGIGSASRILTKGAAYLFTSLFKRQAPAIAATEHWVSTPEADDRAAAEDIPPLEFVPDENAADMPDQVDEPSASSRPGKDGDGQLENVLKESSLTREQCERYIKLLKSKAAPRDPSLDGRDDSRLVVYGENSMDPLPAVSQSDIHYSQADLVPYEPARAPWERNERPTEPQVKRPGRPPFSSRWTPLQTPITGGRELLKRRVPLTDEAGPARRMKDNSVQSGGTGLRKMQGEVDLSCFRKETKTSLGSAILPVPKQSARTARKIMDSLDKKSLKSRPLVRKAFAEAKGTRFSKTASTSPLTSLTDPRDRLMVPQQESSKGKSTDENVNNGEASSWHENPVKSVRFSFPLAASGSEPPTPKVLPVLSTPISRNGDLVTIGSSEASPCLSNLASSSTLNETSVAAGKDEDISNLVARAEKVTSLLSRATAPATLTKTMTRISDTSDTSPDYMKPTANGFYTFAAATTGGDHVTDQNPYPCDQSTAAENPFLIGTAKVSSTSFFVDAQSLAPPETSNNPFAATTLTVTKSLGKSKRKLTKRIR